MGSIGLVPSIILLLILVSLVIERIILNRSCAGLRIRIHVGGTRGKTSVTRYLSAGLRSSGQRTCAKVTGTRAATISADGTERPIKRRGGPRVGEQFDIMRWAARQKADALVLECMSISPELQRLESRELKPHLLVMTKIRDDHREHLGGVAEQVNAMCEVIPENSVVITDDRDHEEIIRRVAGTRNSRVIGVADTDLPAGVVLPAGVHKSNVVLALRACQEAGADISSALSGILDEASKRSERSTALELGDKRGWFVNGFAVNDIESAQGFVDSWRAKLTECKSLVIMLNTRTDRPLRSRTFAAWIARLEGLADVILIGDHAAWTQKALKRLGLPANRIHIWRDRQIKQPLTSFGDVIPDRSLVVGLGNTRGDGLAITRNLVGRGVSQC